MNQKYPSILLENAVNEFAKLPGIGRKTALRLILYLLRQDNSMVDGFAEALVKLRHDVNHCCICHNICDGDICTICNNTSRDRSTVCVVENIKEVMAIETQCNTKVFIMY